MINRNTFGNLPPVTLNLIIVNALVYIAAHALPALGIDVYKLLSLYYPGSGNFMPHQLISHMFMHASFFHEVPGGARQFDFFGLMHIFFNMMILSFSGRMLEPRWGGKNFLIVYLLSGLAAAGLQIGASYIPFVASGAGSMLGASGAVLGILFVFLCLNPHVRMMLIFPPIPLSAKTMRWVIIVGSLVMGILGIASGIAHFAHLGGALAGFLLAKYWLKEKIRLLT